MQNDETMDVIEDLHCTKAKRMPEVEKNYIEIVYKRN